MDKELRVLIAKARKAGWRVEELSHPKFFAPDGHTMIVASGTPGDWRSTKNLRARLKRAGLEC